MFSNKIVIACRNVMKAARENPSVATKLLSASACSAGGLVLVGPVITETLEKLIGREYVISLIDEKKVLVVSKSTCFCCRESRKVLDSYHIKKDCIKILEINNRDDMVQIQDYMQTSTGSKSVPRVFIGGDFIGGNVDIKTMHGNGKLMLLLEEAGVLEKDTNCPFSHI